MRTEYRSKILGNRILKRWPIFSAYARGILQKTTASLWVALCPIVAPFGASAADYGYFGAVFPVIEPSLLDTINARLGEMDANGELDTMRDEMQATTRSYATRPRPVAMIGHTQDYRTYEVDLSITVAQDIADHNGVVFARAGTKINPLDHSRFQQRLVFIDGDVEEQVAFALSIAETEPTKIILINGEPLSLTQAHGRRFWFDQEGIISGKFLIANVPAVVTRSYPNMIVEEIPLNKEAE